MNAFAVVSKRALRAVKVATLAVAVGVVWSCQDTSQRNEEVARSAAATPAAIPTFRPKVDRDRELFKEMLAVNLLEKAFLPKEAPNGGGRDLESFRLSYRNTGTKEIRAFSGAVVFSDLSDKEFFRVRLACQARIAPGATEIEDRTIELDHLTPEHDRLVTTPLENMMVRFEPKSILFSDGSKVGSDENAANPPAMAKREERSALQRAAGQADDSAAMARWREEGRAEAKRAAVERAAEAKARHMHEGPDGFMHCDPGYVSAQNECVPAKPDGPNEFWTGRGEPRPGETTR